MPGAFTTYRSVVSIYPDSKTSQTAISGIVRVLKQDDKLGQLFPELNSIISTHSSLAASDYARQQIVPILVAEQSFSEAADHVNNLFANYSGTDFEQYVLFDQLFLLESQAGGGQNKASIENGLVELSDKLSTMPNSTLKRYLSIKIATQPRFASQGEEPVDMIFARNYPNPFNPETTIEYQLPEDGFVKIEIFNLLGQKIRTLVNTVQPAGINQIQWDSRNDSGTSVASGIYLYLIQSREHVKTGKIFLLK